MVFLSFRIAAAVAVAAKLAAAGAEDKVGPTHWCDVAMDFVHVQDATSSFDGLWRKMESQIGRVVDELENVNVKNRYAFTTFGDKPIQGDNKYQLGYKDDYCFKVDVPLGKPNAVRMEHLFATYQQHARGGGGDWAENSFGAILRAIYAPAVKWTADVKTIILITDALGHRSGDVAKLTGVEVAENTLNSPEQLVTPNAGCSSMDYPSIQQVAQALDENNISLVIFAAPAGMYDANGAFRPYSFIAKEGKKYRQPNGLALWYKDQFDAAGKSVYSVMIDAELDTFASSIIKAIDDVASSYCSTPEPLHPTTAPASTTLDLSTVTVTTTVMTQTTKMTLGSTTASEDASSEGGDPTLPGQGVTGGCGGEVTDEPTLPGQGATDGCIPCVHEPFPLADPQPVVVEVNLNVNGLPTPDPQEQK